MDGRPGAVTRLTPIYAACLAINATEKSTRTGLNIVGQPGALTRLMPTMEPGGATEVVGQSSVQFDAPRSTVALSILVNGLDPERSLGPLTSGGCSTRSGRWRPDLIINF